MKKNERLESVLKATPKRKPTKRRYAFEDRAFAAKASKIGQAKRGPVMATRTCRVHTDAYELCRSAWKDSSERIVEMSSALRNAAKAKLGI